MTAADSVDGVEPRVAVAVLLGVTLLAAGVTVGFLWTITPAEEPRTPNVQFNAEQDVMTTTVDGERIEVTRVTFRHEGGDSIDAENLEVWTGIGRSRGLGLGPDGELAAFEGDTVTHGDEVAVVATSRLERGDDRTGVTFAVEPVEGERRLTDGTGTVLELEPGDEVSIVWFDGEQASTLQVLEVEDAS